MPDQSVGDVFALSDSVRFSTFGLRLILSDNFNLSDLVRTSRTQSTLLSDTISISDTMSAVLNLVLGVSDSLFIFDALLASSPLGISDTISLSDTLAISLSFTLGLSDIISISDTVSSPLGISDSLSISDSLLVNLAFGISEGLTVSDSIANSLISISLANSQLVSDTLFLLDSISYTNSNSLIALGNRILFSDRINVLLNSTENGYLRRYLNDVVS